MKSSVKVVYTENPVSGTNPANQESQELFSTVSAFDRS